MVRAFGSYTSLCAVCMRRNYWNLRLRAFASERSVVRVHIYPYFPASSSVGRMRVLGTWGRWFKSRWAHKKKHFNFEVLFFIFGFYNVWRTQTKLSKGFKWNTPWPTVLQAFINLSDFQNFLKCKPNVNSAIKILGGLNRLSHFQKINKIKKQSTIL